jgi:hypothetical protein
MNFKFINTKQTIEVHAYTNIERTLYKTNTAIWFNKTCRDKELTPKYNVLYNTKKYISLLQYVKPEAANTVFELLMMKDVSLETCWAIKKRWNNKF